MPNSWRPDSLASIRIASHVLYLAFCKSFKSSCKIAAIMSAQSSFSPYRHAWGMDVIGPIDPKAANGHRFILVAIDYFTKWVEDVTFKVVTRKAMVDFVHSNIICCFANGAIEVANKNIKKILRKMIQGSRQWHEKLHFALLGYCTNARTSIGTTPYLLVYGTKVVILVEVEIRSLRIIIELEIKDTEWVKT
ncbi:uncharacterized protein [Nicotiana sylvestris]|uniref:uncharacterized protein n=1 Tax=Nicotiana sylvestris TaxID=4096 RepID=UPI00388C767F